MKTRIEIKSGVAHLILDDPDEKLNTLGSQLLTEIKAWMAEFERDPHVKVVILRSGKKAGFLAGANINELQGIAMERDLEAVRDKGFQAAIVGQRLCDRLEDFPKPVVAAIHGACLGGGLELAMGAHARVVADGPDTKLGLPELKLGIMPGFGGTWRLPRLVGLAKAIPAILSSSNFDGRKALKSGLADFVCPYEYIAVEAEKLALQLLEPGFKEKLWARRRATRGFIEKAMEWPVLRSRVFAVARKEVWKRTGGNYPAPLRFLSHLQANWGRKREEFLEYEAKGLAALLATPVARNLIRIFFLGQGAKKQMGSGTPAKVKELAIVGAGFMGSSIAIPALTRAKTPVLLKDSNDEVLGKALKKIWDFLSKRVKKRQITLVEAWEQYRLAQPVTRDTALKSAGLVIEAVPEILDLKRKIFAALEAVVPVSTVLATNTSTLPIKDIAQGSKHPSRLIGMHFFSPAEVMPLVEIIPGPETSPDTLATVVDYTLRIGKTPVVVKDSPGFLVNRILLPYILEAVQMVQEGVPPAEVDRSATQFGMPVGPIKLMGEVGIEVIVKVFHILQAHFGDHLPKPKWMDRADLAKAFPRGKDGKLKVDQALIASWVGKANPGLPAADVTDRLFLAMLNEAARCLEEKIVDEPGYLDLAMIYGTGFPPFKGGLLREADSRGLEALVKRGRELAGRYGKHLDPPAALSMRQSFYGAA